MAGEQTPPAPGSYDEVIAAQAEMIKQLRVQLDEVAARMPAPVAASVQAGTRFPMHVYRPSGKKGQADHPGIDTKIVGSELELEAHEQDGWRQAKDVPVNAWGAPEPVVEVAQAPAPKAGKK